MVQGIKEMTAKFTVAIPKKVRDATRDAMEKGATETVAMMKRLVPKKTHELANSIGWTWGDAPAGSFIVGTVKGREYLTMRITIYAGNEKTMVEGRSKRFQLARLMEFGTVDIRAHSFFYTSYRSQKERMKRRVKRAVKEAIRSTPAAEPVGEAA